MGNDNLPPSPWSSIYSPKAEKDGDKFFGPGYPSPRMRIHDIKIKLINPTEDMCSKIDACDCEVVVVRTDRVGDFFKPPIPIPYATAATGGSSSILKHPHKDLGESSGTATAIRDI